MQVDPLKIFYDDETTRKAVRAFMLSVVDEQLLETAYNGKDVSGYKEAREVIDGTFNKLRNLYAQEKSSNQENKAR